MASTSTTMTKVISQVGDSTDEEDYELEDECNFVEKMNEQFKKSNCTKKYKDKKNQISFNISTSCKLKTIGHLILQNENIRNEYKKIKAGFIPEDLKEECAELDKLFKGNWFKLLLHNNFKPHLPGWGSFMYRIYYTEPLDNFFKESAIFKEPCNLKLKDSQKNEYNVIKELFSSEDYDIRGKSVEKLINRIYCLHKEIKLHNERIMQRENTELIKLSEQSQVEPHACLALARLRASLKLDRDMMKNFIEEGLFNKWEEEKYVYTQKNESLKRYRWGRFTLYKENLGRYADLSNTLIDWKKEGFNENKLKDFIKFALRGKLDKSIVTNENKNMDKWLEKLLSIIELIFGIEIKRNSAALLTGAMFFDLLHDGIYKLNDLSTKMPMATPEAVNSGAYIDKIMNKPSRPNAFDADENVLKFVQREENILQDWLKFKLKTDQDFIENVPAQKFNALILDWYGIELPQLKKGTIKIERVSKMEEELVSTAQTNGTPPASDLRKKKDQLLDEGETEPMITFYNIKSETPEVSPKSSKTGLIKCQNGVLNDNDVVSKENLALENNNATKSTIDLIQETPSKILAKEVSSMKLVGGDPPSKRLAKNLARKLEEEDFVEEVSARKRPAEDPAADSTVEDSPKKLAVGSSTVHTAEVLRR